MYKSMAESQIEDLEIAEHYKALTIELEAKIEVSTLRVHLNFDTYFRPIACSNGIIVIINLEQPGVWPTLFELQWLSQKYAKTKDNCVRNMNDTGQATIAVLLQVFLMFVPILCLADTGSHLE
ncbi:hypothetical protein NQ314_002167 [Rhamnusium bicolor]|uniref:Uncharacterized protein n=1 Tax=Rhamnusium bicolor TaxID=1586634 RepID=A0AAV8ZSC2_9CUCU|nr:hypothetical protein NQ314_002167 [Rhamnusium bicolor]